MKLVTKPIITRTLVILLFLGVLGSQTSLFSRESQPRIDYRIHVDMADLSGFDVEMRIRGAGELVRFAMAAHPIYDDRASSSKKSPAQRRSKSDSGLNG